MLNFFFPFFHMLLQPLGIGSQDHTFPHISQQSQSLHRIWPLFPCTPTNVVFRFFTTPFNFSLPILRCHLSSLPNLIGILFSALPRYTIITSLPVSVFFVIATILEVIYAEVFLPFWHLSSLSSSSLLLLNRRFLIMVSLFLAAHPLALASWSFRMIHFFSLSFTPVPESTFSWLSSYSLQALIPVSDSASSLSSSSFSLQDLSSQLSYNHCCLPSRFLAQSHSDCSRSLFPSTHTTVALFFWLQSYLPYHSRFCFSSSVRHSNMQSPDAILSVLFCSFLNFYAANSSSSVRQGMGGGVFSFSWAPLPPSTDWHKRISPPPLYPFRARSCWGPPPFRLWHVVFAHDHVPAALFFFVLLALQHVTRVGALVRSCSSLAYFLLYSEAEQDFP